MNPAPPTNHPSVVVLVLLTCHSTHFLSPTFFKTQHAVLGGSIHVRARFFCLPRHLHVLVAHPVPQMKARNQRPTKGPKFLQNPGVAQRNARDQEQHQEEVKDLARSAQILAQKAKQYERMQAAALGGASESESARWSPPTGICVCFDLRWLLSALCAKQVPVVLSRR